jgi:hypothetical protein
MHAGIKSVAGSTRSQEYRSVMPRFSRASARSLRLFLPSVDSAPRWLRKNTSPEPETKSSAHFVSGEQTTTSLVDLLRAWLSRGSETDALRWFDGEIDRQRSAVDERRFGMALGLAGRRIDRSELILSADDLTTANAIRLHWRPDLWLAVEAARVALVLATWKSDEESFAGRVDRLCLTGELTEHVALLKGFAIFPAPLRFLGRAREAVRSSIAALLEAVACHNPYPAEHFDEAAFNQMVVKCVFGGVAIEKIIGLEERRNDDLLRMLGDLVSERRAAGRTVPDTVLCWIGW